MDMKQKKTNKAIETRLEMEILVDTYDESERAMGWFYYLENKITFPFKAKCISEIEISPLMPNDEVDVVGMADENVCQHRMFVKIKWPNKKQLSVPLEQLQGINVDPATKEAMGDWCYWVIMRYEI